MGIEVFIPPYPSPFHTQYFHATMSMCIRMVVRAMDRAMGAAIPHPYGSDMDR